MRAINQPNESAESRPRSVAVQRLQAGFTLVELLVVIALTAILLTVIFVPLVNSYALTSKADTQIASQSNARATLSNLTNLLSSADFVYDNAVTTQLNGAGQTVVGSEINLWLPEFDGKQYSKPVSFAMLEAVIPARQLDASPYTYDSMGNPIATPIDPTTNQPIYDPGLSPGLSGFQLPLAPGRVLTRIFVGLTNNAVDNGTGLPVVPYSNQFEDKRSSFNNRYTLYRAEVTAYIQDPNVSPSGPNTPYVPNLGLFHTVDASGNVTNNINDTLRLHDPNFFYDNSPAGGNAATSKLWKVKGWVDLNNDGICEIWENWAALSVSLMPKDKVDMVALDRSADTNQVTYYDNTGQPQNSPGPTDRPNARTLAVFKPTYVQNDVAVPTSLDNSGNETPLALSPTYMTQYGHWTRPYRVIVYRAPNGLDSLKQDPLTYYEALGAYGGDTRIFSLSVPQGMTPPPVPGALPDAGPQPDPKTGAFTNLTAPFAFTVNADKGIINFSYSSTVLVNKGPGGLPPYGPLPQRYDTATINNLDPAHARRYVDLRAALPAPLNPPSAVSPLNTMSPWYADVHVVPGSELVYGPDQQPGPHYGYRIRYTRIPSLSINAVAIGPNQYRINYENNSNPGPSTDPSLYVGYIEFQQGTDPTPTASENPALKSYKAIVLPTLRADLVNAGVNLPADNVEVSYSFTMVRPNDVVKVDYMTRDLMNVALEVRLYDIRSGLPQIISLSDKIKVRNLQH